MKKQPRFIGDHWFWNHVPFWRWTNAIYARIYGQWRPGLTDQFLAAPYLDLSTPEHTFFADRKAVERIKLR